MYFKIYLTQVYMVNYRQFLNFPSSYRCISYAYQNYDLIMVNNVRTCTFENSVEFENSKTNLIHSFKKYKLDIPNETGPSTESRPSTNETRSPGDGFIDRKLLSQTGLNHHISRSTVFNPLNRCILWGKKQMLC